MTINIEYETDKPLDVDYEKVANDIIPAALDYEKCPYEAEVNLILTDNDAIQEINRDYRQIDRPTDVLSFPMIDFEKESDFSHVEEAVEEYLGIRDGETTEDGIFTLNTVACLGCCSLAPVMMIKSSDGEETYGNLTKDSVVKILDEIRNRKPGEVQ